MKPEKTVNLKLQYVKNIQTTTTQMKTIHNSDIDLSEKITEVMRKTQILKVNHRSKAGVTIAEGTDIALLNADKNNKTTRINHKSVRNHTHSLSIH